MYRYLASLLDMVICSPLKVFLAWLGGLLVEWWVGCPGGVRVLLQVALLFYVLDTLSGLLCVLCPQTPGKFSSLRFRDAFAKLINYAIVVLLGMGIDALGDLGYMVTGLLLALIVLAEGMSVIENTGRLGFKYPPGFTQFFESLCRRGDDVLQDKHAKPEGGAEDDAGEETRPGE